MSSDFSATAPVEALSLRSKLELVPRGSIPAAALSKDPSHTHTLHCRRKESLCYEIACFAEQMAKLHAERDFGLKTGKGPNARGFDIPNAQPLLDGIRQRYHDVRLNMSEEVEVQRCLTEDYQAHYQSYLRQLYRSELGVIERWTLALKEMLGL